LQLPGRSCRSSDVGRCQLDHRNLRTSSIAHPGVKEAGENRGKDMRAEEERLRGGISREKKEEEDLMLYEKGITLAVSGY